MFSCSTCENEWPENYCPVCAHTIDRSQVQETPPSNSPLPKRYRVSISSTKTAPIHSAIGSGIKLCPLCGSADTGKAEIKYDRGGFFMGFQAFQNRCCYVCEAAWKPGCPKWVAIVCMISGCAASVLAYLMFTGFAEKWFAVFFGLVPFIYGLDVLVSKGGRLKILSIGNIDLKPLDRNRSK